MRSSGRALSGFPPLLQCRIPAIRRPPDAADPSKVAAIWLLHILTSDMDKQHHGHATHTMKNPGTIKEPYWSRNHSLTASGQAGEWPGISNRF